MAEIPDQDGDQSQHQDRPRLRRSKPKPQTTETTYKFTLRSPPHTYIHLQIITLPTPSSSTSTSTSTTQPPTQIQTQHLDPITLRQHLTAALFQFLGLSGTAIDIDILHIRNPTPTDAVGDQHADQRSSGTQKKRQGGRSEAFIRVPTGDAAGVAAALSQYSSTSSSSMSGSLQTRNGLSLRVLGRGSWLGALVGRADAEADADADAGSDGIWAL